MDLSSEKTDVQVGRITLSNVIPWIFVLLPVISG